MFPPTAFRLLKQLPPVAAMGLLGLLHAPLRAADDSDREPPPWDAAISLTTTLSPERAGAGRQKLHLTPGLYLRYGRFSLSTAKGFIDRRNDEVLRGLSLDMVHNDRLKVDLSLRLDQGRRESTSDDLRGMGSIPATARLRLGLQWTFAPDWSVAADWTVDAFGRGGGNFGGVGLRRGWRLSPQTTFGLAAGITLGGDRYMQTWYGVSPEQSRRSGFPAYDAPSGLRDAALSVNARTELSRHWILIGNASVSRLLGPAARSPLTLSANGWSAGVGLAYRF